MPDRFETFKRNALGAMRADVFWSLPTRHFRRSGAFAAEVIGSRDFETDPARMGEDLFTHSAITLFVDTVSCVVVTVPPAPLMAGAVAGAVGRSGVGCRLHRPVPAGWASR